MSRTKSEHGERVRWILIDIRDEDAEALDKMARDNKTTRAKIVRRALAEYLHTKFDDMPEKRRKILYDVITHKNQSEAAKLNNVSKQYVSSLVKELET